MTKRKKKVLDREYLDVIKRDDDREALETLLYMGVDIAVGKRLPKPTEKQEFRTDPLNNAGNSTERLKLRTDDHAVFVKTGIKLDSLRYRRSEGNDKFDPVIPSEHYGQLSIGDDVEFLIPSVKGVPVRVHGWDWQSLEGHTRIPPTQIQKMDVASPRWVETPRQTRLLQPDYRLHFQLQSWLYEDAFDKGIASSPDRRPLPSEAYDNVSKLQVVDLTDYVISALSIEFEPEYFLKVVSFMGGMYLPDIAKAHNEYQGSLLGVIENHSQFSGIRPSKLSVLISESIEYGTEWKYQSN